MSDLNSHLDANLKVFDEHFDRFDTAAQGGKGDGIVSREDLRAVANDTRGRYSQEERDAAIYLLNNKDAFRLLDTGGKWSKADVTDDKIGRDDVKSAIRNNPKFAETETFASDGALIPRGTRSGGRDPVEAAEMLRRCDEESRGSRALSTSEFTRLVSEHRNDPRWLQDFFRALGAKNTASYLGSIANPERIDSTRTASLVDDEVAMVRDVLENMYASGALKDADIACLVEQWALQPGETWSLGPDEFNTGVPQMFAGLQGPHAQELQNAFFHAASQFALGEGAGRALSTEQRGGVAAAGAFVLGFTDADNQVRELTRIKEEAGGDLTKVSEFITLAMSTPTRTTTFSVESADKPRPATIRYEGAARLVSTLSRFEPPKNGNAPGPWTLNFPQIVKLRDAVFYGATNGIDANKDDWQANTALKDSLSKIFMADFDRMMESEKSPDNKAGFATSSGFPKAFENFAQHVLFTMPSGKLHAETSAFLIERIRDVFDDIRNPNVTPAQFLRWHGADRTQMSHIVGVLAGHVVSGMKQAAEDAGDKYAERKAQVEFAIDLLFALCKDFAKIAPGGTFIEKMLGFSETVSALKGKGIEELKKLGSGKVAEELLSRFPDLRLDENYKFVSFVEMLLSKMPVSDTADYKVPMLTEYDHIVGPKRAAAK